MKKLEFLPAFKIVKSGSLARLGELHLGNQRLQTPVFWAGYKYKLFDFWERHKDLAPKIEATALNAYSMLRESKLKNFLQRISQNRERSQESVKRILKLKSSFTMIDSGGFQFLTQGKIDATPQMIFDIQYMMKMDLAIVLDFPLTNSLSQVEKQERLSSTLSSLKYYVKETNVKPLTFLPVIHGDNYETLSLYLKKVKKVLGNDKIPAFAIGSVEATRFPLKITRLRDFVKAFVKIRYEYPESLIHILGAGSSLLLNLFAYLGADSMDSMSWFIEAAFGQLHIAGYGSYYIHKKGRRKKDKFLEGNEHLLHDCKCTTCRSGVTLEEYDQRNANALFLRATHNLCTYLNELEEIRTSISEGRIKERVMGNLRHVRLYRVLNTKIN